MSKSNGTFQRLIIKGNISNNPIFKILPNGTAVINFHIAVNRKSKNSADFIPCVAWQDSAKIINDNCSKGTSLMFEGKITTSFVEDSEGRKKPEIQVEVLEDGILDIPKKANTAKDEPNKNS